MLARVRRCNPLRLPANSPVIFSMPSSLSAAKPSVTAASFDCDDEPIAAASSSGSDDPVRQLVSGLRGPGAEGFVASPRFGAVVSELNRFQVDRVVGALKAESPDSAVAFFEALRNEYGFRHSRFSWLLVAHVLAGKRELGRLRWVLQQMVEEE
ncbi:hypothetical protein BT93_L5719, partial [Corymbia citriodora subsp. variegata]